MKDELVIILKNHRVLGILFLLPVIYTIIFGGLFYKNLVTGVPIIVVNLDDGTDGQNLIHALDDTPEVKIISIIGDADKISLQMLEDGASGAVVIPKDYSQKISRGESVSVELIIDNTNTILGGVVTRAVQSVISTRSAEILATQRIAAGWDTYSAEKSFLTLSTRIFYNPTSGYTDFFLAVLILHSMQIAIVFAIAPAFIEEKFSRREIFHKPLKILSTKILIFTVIEVAIISICLSVGIKFFGLICRGNFWEIISIATAFSFAMTTFALAAGAWVKIPYHAINYTLAYVMPSILFTGAIWPRFSMDDLSLFFSYIMPIGWAANDLRNLFLKGIAVGWESHAVILILFGGIFFVIGICGLKFTGSGRNVSDSASRNFIAD